MKTRKQATPEGAVLSQCLALLKLRSVLHWRQNSGQFAVGPNEDKRYVRAGFAGVSDILGCLPGGRFLAIEVKRPGGKMTEAQRDFLAKVNAAGGLGVCVDDVTELDKVLSGVLK